MIYQVAQMAVAGTGPMFWASSTRQCGIDPSFSSVDHRNPLRAVLDTSVVDGVPHGATVEGDPSHPAVVIPGPGGRTLDHGASRKVFVKHEPRTRTLWLGPQGLTSAGGGSQVPASPARCSVLFGPGRPKGTEDSVT